MHVCFFVYLASLNLESMPWIHFRITDGLEIEQDVILGKLIPMNEKQ